MPINGISGTTKSSGSDGGSEFFSVLESVEPEGVDVEGNGVGVGLVEGFGVGVGVVSGDEADKCQL